LPHKESGQPQPLPVIDALPDVAMVRRRVQYSFTHFGPDLPTAQSR
jgi:hypothetical protein